MAKGLGEDKAVELLDANLKDEKETLREVEKIATRLSNEHAKQGPRPDGSAGRVTRVPSHPALTPGDGSPDEPGSDSCEDRTDGERPRPGRHGAALVR